MKRWAGWALAGVALVWGGVAGVNWLTPKIEQDVANRTNTVFAEKGLLFATAQVKGREVTVVGDAPDAEAHDKALSAAAHVFGVAKVMDGMSIDGVLVKVSATETTLPEEPIMAAKATDYRLVITKNGESVTLSGMVPDEASRAVLVRLATDRYGAENVVDKMALADGAPEGWRSAVGTVLFNLSSLEKATATISNTEVMVDGEALDQAFADKAEDNMKKAMPTAYKVAYAVDVQGPTLAKVESPTAKVEAMAQTPAAAVEPAAGGVLAEAAERTERATDKVADQAAAVIGDLMGKASKAMGGCASEELGIHKVMFAFDSAKITKVYDGTMDKVAGIMTACGDLNVTVAGHTDRAGSGLYNQWLSEQRAEAGMRALMKRGVDKAHLSTKGYGETKPVGSDTTREGRAANRRIEFVPGTSITVLEPATGEAVSGTMPAGSWWDRISGAITRAEVAVSSTVDAGK
ncbi:MAG: OmpA family protein [Alphaproteobacteria bacterium]